LDAEQLASTLILKEFEVLLLHGDMGQQERNKVITMFKKQEVNILVATDVAGQLHHHHQTTLLIICTSVQ
jgi:superfamily II DNA/RNA helicase